MRLHLAVSVTPVLAAQVCAPLPPLLRDLLPAPPAAPAARRTPRGAAGRTDCVEAAPNHLAVAAALVTLFAALAVLRSARVLAWWLRRVVFPATGRGAVYGVSLVKSKAISAADVAELKAHSAACPDLSRGVGRRVSKDEQQRFWVAAGRNAARAQRALIADTAWRKKLRIDGLLKVGAHHIGRHSAWAHKPPPPQAVEMRLSRPCNGTPLSTDRPRQLHLKTHMANSHSIAQEWFVTHQRCCGTCRRDTRTL